MELSSREWKEFNFIDVFIIKCGFYNKKPQKEINGIIPFLGATDSKNCITEFYSLNVIKNSSRIGTGKNEDISRKLFDGNCICITNNGSVGYAYYQAHQFTCSHDVNPLYLKSYKLNRNIAMFLISSIEQQRVCFEYSRKWRPSRMKKSKLLLPINKVGEPDYEFMEQYIKELNKKKLNEHKEYAKNKLKDIKYKEIEPLDNKEWKEFFIEDICNIKSGQDIYEAERKIGNIPYITSTASNNGIKYYVSNTNNTIEDNAISVNRNGSVGYAFYHKYKALYSNDCRKLKLKQSNNEYVALFLTNQILKQKEKYSYGYKMGTGRLRKQAVMLPINMAGKTDYEYMEQYIKNSMFKKYNNYLEYANKKAD